MGRTEKFRASRTHGRGMKSGRGAGKRGGKGNAGLHKHKYISIVKYQPNYFGRHGFKRPQKVVSHDITINVSKLADHIGTFIENGHAKKDGDRFWINLQEVHVDKLLGAGNIGIPIDITVSKASAKAITKVEEAGGSVTLLGPEAQAETVEEDADIE